ncbi:hypothetical protein MPTK2_8g18460 [Marchantia polymorpha subsp. ruderalis]
MPIIVSLGQPREGRQMLKTHGSSRELRAIVLMLKGIRKKTASKEHSEPYLSQSGLQVTIQYQKEGFGFQMETACRPDVSLNPGRRSMKVRDRTAWQQKPCLWLS